MAKKNNTLLEIDVNKNGEITGESKILETPVTVFKKVIQYY
jgi:hypothetical protein